MTCTKCGQPVTYDEATKLHHCGKCIRVGERVEWRVGGEEGERLTGTVTGFDLERENRVMVLWDHLTLPRALSESIGFLRHISVLDLMVEALDG